MNRHPHFIQNFFGRVYQIESHEASKEQQQGKYDSVRPPVGVLGETLKNYYCQSCSKKVTNTGSQPINLENYSCRLIEGNILVKIISHITPKLISE